MKFTTKMPASLISIALMAACGSDHKSKAAPPQPAPQTIPVNPDDTKPKPLELPEKSSREAITTLLGSSSGAFDCVKTSEGSLYVDIHLAPIQIPGQTNVYFSQTRFTDDRCRDLAFRIVRYGTTTVSKFDGKKGEVSIHFDADFFIFSNDAPAALKESCAKIENRRTQGLAASSAECGLAMVDYNATWNVDLSARKAEVNAVDDSAFGFAQAPRLLSLSNTSRGYSSIEQLRCDADSRPHFWDRGTSSCRVRGELDSASADSVIQYEKDSGLFPDIKVGKEILSKATGAMQYLVDYDYSCTINFYRNKKETDPNMVFLIGTVEDGRYIKLGKHREEFLSRRDLELGVDSYSTDSFLLGPLQVQPGCSLKVEVQAKQVAE